MIAAFLIWSVMAVCFVILGISCRFSRKPVGFWANIKSNETTDVKKYNGEVSNLWLAFALFYELLGIPLLFMEQNSPLVLLVVLGTVFLVIAIMIVYTKIESK